MVITLIVIALVALLSGVPFAFSLLMGTVLATLVFDPSGLLSLPLLAMSDINDPLIIAIPMLIIAGQMLSEVGAIEPIIEVWEWLFGKIEGSLGLCCVGTSLFFAGSTGSTAAESAAVATAFAAPMERRGYSRRYVGSLVVASCAVGLLFPPSLAMILYAQVINYPVTQLWVAGIFPGVMTGVLIAIVSIIMARRMFRIQREQEKVVKVTPTATPVELLLPDMSREATPDMGRSRKIVATILGLMIPAFVVAGIYSGTLTLSEVAASLVGIITLYGLFVTRIGSRRLFGAVRLGGQRAGAVFMIIIAARLFSNVLVEQQTIIKIINLVNEQHLSKFWILLLSNIAMLAAGTLMDGLSLIIIGAPLLYALLTPFGITPVHLAIIMAMNLEIGVMHPPLGGNLFAVSAVTGERVGKIAWAVLPYLGVLLFMLMLVTYVPVPGFAWNN